MWLKNTILRYFLEFSYNGTKYHGWQKQPNAISVQEILEDRISKILGNKIDVTAAGRTDTGVHAKKMIGHFDAEIEDVNHFIFRINSFLPKDIAVFRLIKVVPNAHARFDATERTYQYHINCSKNPFSTELSWYWSYENLNMNQMNLAAKTLFDYEDFTSFARLHADNKTNICCIKEAFFIAKDDQLIFTITANRFLRNMVRSIVGTLVEVGQDKISIDQFRNIIEKKDRKFASASAPAHGLFLTEVKYPQHIYL